MCKTVIIHRRSFVFHVYGYRSKYKFTRAIYHDIEARTSWYNFFAPSNDTIRELRFWLKNLSDHQGYSIKHKPAFTKVIFSDPSDTGFGGFVCERLNELICSGSFSSPEAPSSSTTRELLAIKYVLQSFSHLLKGGNSPIEYRQSKYF